MHKTKRILEMLKARFEVVTIGADYLLIRDIGPWDKHPTVTNDVEAVVEHLILYGEIIPGQQGLLYIDSGGQKDEIIIENGKFYQFKPLRRE